MKESKTKGKDKKEIHIYLTGILVSQYFLYSGLFWQQPVKGISFSFFLTYAFLPHITLPNISYILNKGGIKSSVTKFTYFSVLPGVQEYSSSAEPPCSLGNGELPLLKVLLPTRIGILLKTDQDNSPDIYPSSCESTVALQVTV